MAIDIMCLLAVASGFYIGFSKGIISTVFSLLSLFFGLIAAFKFTDPMTQFLKTSFNSDNPLMFAAGFALSFVITMFLIRLFARGLEGAMKTAKINVVNQMIGGGVLGAAMVVVFSVLLWFGDQARLVNDNAKLTSITYPHLQQIPGKAKGVTSKLTPIFKDFWDQSLDMMDRLQDMSVEQTENSNVYDIPEDEPTEDTIN